MLRKGISHCCLGVTLALKEGSYVEDDEVIDAQLSEPAARCK